MTRAFVFLFLVGSIAACASRPKPTPPPPRVKDSLPDRSASLNSATRQELRLEDESRFFLIDEAKERKEAQKQAAEKKDEKQERDQALIPMPRMASDGGVVQPLPKGNKFERDTELKPK